jgi:hypothetical protein
MLYVSRALELQIGFKQSFVQSFYGVSCRVFTELRVELLESSVQSSVHPRAPKLYISIILLSLKIYRQK